MSDRLADLRRQVERLFDRNRQVGFAPWCGLRYDFVCPSTGTYPFQWFWDSCFHAIVLARYDVARARAELESLLRHQQPDGFVAHVTFWQRERYEAVIANYCILWRTRYLSDCIQPPVLAMALEAVHRAGAGSDFLAALLPKVRRYYDWLDRVRDPDRDGLISVLLPDETGLDHSPKFDHYLRVESPSIPAFDAAWARNARPYEAAGQDPKRMFALDKFNVEDTMVNALYAENLAVLADLTRALGDSAGAAELDRRSARTTAALVEKCFDPSRGLFFDLAGAREERLATSTFTSLVPLLVRALPSRCVEALVRQLEDPREYACAFPVPSVAMSEPTFHARPIAGRLLWRGPTWVNGNWMIARGLRAHGRHDLADRLADRTAALVEREGFREYYHPFTGEGFGAHAFSWSALAYDMLEDCR